MKWEYYCEEMLSITLVTSTDVTEALTELGHEGWELVCVVVESKGSRAIFKRPVKGKK
jgi:hypothetical protein